MYIYIYNSIVVAIMKAYEYDVFIHASECINGQSRIRSVFVRIKPLYGILFLCLTHMTTCEMEKSTVVIMNLLQLSLYTS